MVDVPSSAPRGRNALVIGVVGQDEVVIERAALSIGRDRCNNFFQNTHKSRLQSVSAALGLPNLDGDVESQS